MRQLLPQLRKLGVKIAYNTDGQLMHSRNPDAEELMWILLYADDISLVCDNIESLRAAVTIMDATFVLWGLTISIEKTKVLAVGKDAAEQSPHAVIIISGEVLEVIFQPKCLGSMFTHDGMLGHKDCSQGCWCK